MTVYAGLAPREEEEILEVRSQCLGGGVVTRVEQIAERLDVYSDEMWAMEIDLADKTHVLEQLYDSWLDADHALTMDAFGLMLAERALVGRSEDLLWRHEVRQRQKRLLSRCDPAYDDLTPKQWQAEMIAAVNFGLFPE